MRPSHLTKLNSKPFVAAVKGGVAQSVASTGVCGFSTANRWPEAGLLRKIRVSSTGPQRRSTCPAPTSWGGTHFARANRELILETCESLSLAWRVLPGPRTWPFAGATGAAVAGLLAPNGISALFRVVYEVTVSVLGSGLQNSILAERSHATRLAPNSAKVEFCKPDPISRDRAILDSDFPWLFSVWC